jgi:hypothetical protein
MALTPVYGEVDDTAGSAVSGHRYEDLTWVSAGRE